jgi:hypothetical protein
VGACPTVNPTWFWPCAIQNRLIGTQLGETISAMRPVWIAMVVGCLLAGCNAGNGNDDVEVDDDGYEILAKIDWEVEPGHHYYCVRKTITEDTYVASFEALAPPGTHHTVVTLGEPNGPDGYRECGSFEHNFEQFVYESSSGSNRFDIPEGMAAFLPAGKQMNLNVHILNASDNVMTGTSGARILRRDPAEVEQTATAIYMGRLSLDVPPGESTQVGACQVSADVDIFGVLPHMHSHGSHMKVIAKSTTAGDQPVHDEEFIFDSTKRYYAFEPVPMKQGDTVEVHCSYNNTTGDTLVWGPDSYTAEMCFAAIYVTPAENMQALCAI